MLVERRSGSGTLLAVSERERYDDEQVALILRRAAELQSSGPGAPSADSRRMSLAEVEAIASEAGIDAALVRHAARELSQPPAPVQRPHALLGAPAALHCEARVMGEIPDSRFELLVELIVQQIQVSLGEPGMQSRIGRSLTWQTMPASGQPGRRIAVNVTVSRGATVIRIDEKLGNLIGGLFGGLLGGMGGGGMGLIAIPIVFAPWAAPLFVGGWLGGTYLLTRTIYKAAVRRRSEELEQLLHRLVAVCEDSIEPPMRAIT